MRWLTEAIVKYCGLSQLVCIVLRCSLFVKVEPGNHKGAIFVWIAQTGMHIKRIYSKKSKIKSSFCTIQTELKKTRRSLLRQPFSEKAGSEEKLAIWYHVEKRN